MVDKSAYCLKYVLTALSFIVAYLKFSLEGSYTMLRESLQVKIDKISLWYQEEGTLNPWTSFKVCRTWTQDSKLATKTAMQEH